MSENLTLASTELHSTDTEMKFTFRLNKELGTRRSPVTLNAPVPTWDGLVVLLSKPENDKVRSFVLDLVSDAIRNAVQDQIVDSSAPVNSQAELDLTRVTLEHLATVPKVDRRGSAISEELWKDFIKDYCTIMPALTERSQEQVVNAATYLSKKFGPVKNEKPAIIKLREYLNLWYGHTKQQEEFADVYEYLSKRADTLLSVDEKAWNEAI